MKNPNTDRKRGARSGVVRAMKKFLTNLWIDLNRPYWSALYLLLMICAVYVEQNYGSMAVLVVVVIAIPLAILGARTELRVWYVDKNDYIRRRQEENDRFRERCMNDMYERGKRIGHTRGVADERVEWRKMKNARDWTRKFAHGLLDRLGEIQDSSTVQYSPRVIADWRVELEKHSSAGAES